MSEQGKRAVGVAAAALVENGMTLGLGTGSTVAHFLTALAARRLDVAGLATSDDTARRCQRLGIRLLDPDAVTSVDLAVDGADELTGNLELTKGGGGALLREKVVASVARRMVVIATADKVVERLADTFPLPVEVVPFARSIVQRKVTERGFEVSPRDGGNYRTDNGNAVLDLRRPGGLPKPGVTAAWLDALPGVLEHGLFLDLADEALVGSDDGAVARLTPPS